MSRTINVTPVATPGAGETITSTSYQLLDADGTTVLSTAAPPYVGVSDTQKSVRVDVTQSGGQTATITHVIPGRVTNLAATNAAAPVLTWSDVGGETSYEIHRGAAGFTPDVAGHSTRVGTAAAGATTFTDATVVGDGSTVYAYRVVAITAFGYTIGNQATCTPAVPTPTNYAIQLAGTTGQARTAASVADLVSATGLTFRFRVKGSALIPGASTNRGIIDISDASGTGATGLKILLALVQNASGVVSCYFNIGGTGLQLLTTFNASAITDPTAWYQGLWTWHPAGTTDKRQCIIWKEGTPAPIVDYHNAIAGSALLTTAGIGVLSFGKTISNIYGSNQTDWDFVALYNNSPYTAIGAGAAVPADPTTGDAGILHLYKFPEGSGTTTADAVGGGPSLTLTGATWEAGL